MSMQVEGEANFEDARFLDTEQFSYGNYILVYPKCLTFLARLGTIRS